ncbi:hypothetical protein BKA69DRAFT_1014397, partial [Paraphysoderma sedebokerense]
EVGWLFVQEYYTMMNRDPGKLHRFYNSGSRFTHGMEGEQVKCFQGQEAINKKIQSLNYNDCRVVISNVDSQASQNGGIVVQVIGELSNHGSPSRKFIQMFFLAEQPEGYYVLNDIFRFLKEDIDMEQAIEQNEQTAAPVQTKVTSPVPPEISSPSQGTTSPAKSVTSPIPTHSAKSPVSAKSAAVTATLPPKHTQPQ